MGTKKQTQDPVAEFATACGMPYVNQRWLGGMLTNFQTVAGRVRKLVELESSRAAGDFAAMPKKEALSHERELEKLDRNLGGLRRLDRPPDAIFVIDTKKEHIAVTEANKLHLPVVAVVDTNCDPDVIDYVIPGNDDAIRAGRLMCRVIADAVAEGRFIASRRAVEAANRARRASQESSAPMFAEPDAGPRSDGGRDRAGRGRCRCRAAPAEPRLPSPRPRRDCSRHLRRQRWPLLLRRQLPSQPPRPQICRRKTFRSQRPRQPPRRAWLIKKSSQQKLPPSWRPRRPPRPPQTPRQARRLEVDGRYHRQSRCRRCARRQAPGFSTVAVRSRRATGTKRPPSVCSGKKAPSVPRSARAASAPREPWPSSSKVTTRP